MNRRYIEESFPVKEVSKESAKEKYIRHGNISALHIWWARRPLSSSRVTNYCSLISNSKTIEEWNNKRNFIIELSKWENLSKKSIIERAQKDILHFFGGKKPKILDPFAGGGAIPLEAMRLGCEAYANDYNPVAVLIERCTLEYPQKYGRKLLEDVKKWADVLFQETEKDIGKFFHFKNRIKEKDFFGSSTSLEIPIGYIWARTLTCQNPSCEAEIPLIRQYWLAKTKNKKITLYPYVEEKKVKYKILGTGFKKIPQKFNPKEGSVSRAIATCLVCGTRIEANDVRKFFKQGKSDLRMIAVAYSKKGIRGKNYRIANKQDLKLFKEAEKYLKEKIFNLKEEWVLSPIPDELIVRTGGNQMAILHYGMTTFGDLFNPRQKLSLITFIEKVRFCYFKMIELDYDKEYAKVITTYLSLIISRCSDFESNVARWFNHVENACNTFSRQAIAMAWDFLELNLFSPVSQGTFVNVKKQILRVIEKLVDWNIKPIEKITQSSATELPYDNDYFDAIFTDPPYYDNIFYSNLSDFFYVWLKRCLGDLYPELFSTPLTPKTKEIVADKIRHPSKEDSKNFFENMLKESFKEMHRVLKPDGIAIIVYAHKTTSGWETVINALLDSDLIVTSSWPISTEMKGRLIAKETAALASSIYIIARKLEKTETGFYNEIKKNLKNHLNEKLDRMWLEGISGADFFISAIGIGIEVFGCYNNIIDYEGNEIRADKLLDDIRYIVTDFAIGKILHNGFSGEISPLTRLYIIWRWNYMEVKVPFDEARKLTQSFGVDLEKEWNKGFIEKKGAFISLLGPKNRSINTLKDSKEMIDILHYILLLWEKGENEKIITVLAREFGENEIVYRVAQAISQSLPNSSKEKILLDGFLSGRERIKESIKKSKSQDKIDRWTK